MALNLVAGDKLAWQERKAETFTITRLHAGSFTLGYRPSGAYGGHDGMISLGTAVAISGAAASPNMGYHSSPMVTFLMALFNARLGWWLGNPGVHGRTPIGRVRRDSRSWPFSPRRWASPTTAAATSTSRTAATSTTSASYEMVLRRCHIVVVSDAGCDPDCSFEDLGGAIRKIRIDLGVPIEMESMKLRPRGQSPGAYCAVGRIKYSEVDGTPPADDGWLVYLKPALRGGEPADVSAYAHQHETFPQESTNDQWFSESQFESYRRLGLWEVETILSAGAAGGLADFVGRAQQHVQTTP